MGQIIPYKDKNPVIAPDVFVADGARIIGDVTLGEGSNIWFNTVVRGDIQKVVVGKFTNIQDNCTVHVMASEPTIIGDYVTIGHNAVIHCSKIGNNCLIGMGAVLLGHAVIEDNCVIGAGTIITQGKVIPANSLVYGNPAHIIRDLREDEIEAVKQSAVDYNDIASHYLQK
jgi:carbonic anhydrase/acetyltransferase-like protein (isoleucine patch superfamily)